MLDAWLIASADLDFLLTPGAVLSRSGAPPLRFPLIVHDFGSRRGTLVHTSSGDVVAMHDLAVREGFHSCYLNPADYEAYHREQFMTVLKAWAWYGSGPPPSWYAG
ncbi:MAG TPA: hypothetical protein VH277_04055 [Gemmatimonadaceae bacterium]|jgi:hypothetical protein|nr:hypothetical protein [Gemmatimonadaceae bacterium]